MGFNPTDDGFTLAYSRRILEGQIPHRDFIIIRPFFSPLLHVPVVLLGGDQTYWISRLSVWFQFFSIALCWTSLVNRLLKRPFLPSEKLAIAMIAFAASTHSFPIMAWHTTDGLFLSSLGLLMCLAQKPTIKVIGYTLMAMAYLCKQSFLFLGPFALLILEDWHEKKYWLALTLPGTLYFSFLLATKALPDAIVQLGSQIDIVSVGIKEYINGAMLLSLLTGLVASRFAFGSQIEHLKNGKIQEWCKIYLLFTPLVLTSVALVLGTMFSASFSLFGMLLGVMIYSGIAKPEGLSTHTKGMQLILLFAWSASLSVGYSSPALLSGQLLSGLIAFTYTVRPMATERLLKPALMSASVLILLCFVIGRTQHIYREQAASHLTYRLDQVLRGGKFIKTNQNTYVFLVDLNNAIAIVKKMNKAYTIIPDVAGYWVKSSDINPLPIDWTWGSELRNQKLMVRVTDDLKSKRNKVVVIVQKIHSATLAEGFFPIPEDQCIYPIVGYVRTHLKRIRETRFFELYE
jgi:hypothetical protein